MKKIELLSPAGDMETLKYAIHNGADAVYIGGKNFGARKFARNFTNEELISAFNYARLYGVKIYVTVNTIIFNDEVEEFLKYVEFLYENGVDALIMQDIGMIYYVKKCFQNLEVHASTQCHNHNDEGLKLMESLGVSRVVLDREMSLEDINKLDVPIEKEIFIHGALCVSYSGCCLFSSLNGNRSGNRGECVGACRLPYKLICNDKNIVTDGDYLLSTRELNTTKRLKEILDSKVDSLKIEGRMKSAFYVGFITHIYRMLIDKYYLGCEVKISDEDYLKIAKLFNRKFTEGYLFHDNIINIKSANHQGVRLGKTIYIDKKKIKIKLEDYINQEDAIRFSNSNLGMVINKLYNEKGLLVNHLDKGEILVIDNKINLKDKDIVLKTIDKRQEEEIANYEEKKIPVVFKVEAHIGNNLKITISDYKNEVTIMKSVVSKAINTKITNEDIKSKLAKLGNTCFILDNLVIDSDDDIFIRLSDINNARRELVNLLIDKRINSKKEVIKNTIKLPKVISKSKDNIKFHILVRNEQQLKVCLKYNIETIIVTDSLMYEKYKNKNNVYLRLPRVINNFMDYHNEKLVATELGAINKYPSHNSVISDYYLNVVNNCSINFLKSKNIKLITISPEVKEDNRLKSLDKDGVAIMLYGKMELMIMKYNPLKLFVDNYNYKIEKNKYYLKNKDNHLFRIIDNNNLTHLMHYKNLDEDINKYLNLGFRNFRIDFLDENEEDVEKLIKRYYSNYSDS